MTTGERKSIVANFLLRSVMNMLLSQGGKCIFACLQATCIASLAKLSHGLVQSSSGILNRSFPPRSGVRKRRTVAVSLADGGARFGLETDSASQFPVLVDCTSQSDGST